MTPNHLNAPDELTYNENTPYSLFILSQHNNNNNNPNNNNNNSSNPNHSGGNGGNNNGGGNNRQPSTLNTPVVALQSPMPALTNYHGLSTFAQDFSINAINDNATSTSSSNGMSLTWQNAATTITTTSSGGVSSSAAAIAPSQQNLLTGNLSHHSRYEKSRDVQK